MNYWFFKKDVLLLYFHVFLAYVPLYIIGPFIPQIQQDFWAGKNCILASKNDPICEQALATSAIVMAVIIAIISILNVIISPAFGRLSDTVGRKPILLLGVIMNTLITVSLFLHEKYNVTLYLYYVSYFISRLSPGGIELSYLSDIIDVKYQMNSFSLLIGIKAIVQIIIPLIIFNFSQYIIFTSLCVWKCIHILYFVIFIKESLIEEKKVPFPDSIKEYLPNHRLEILTRTPLLKYLSIIVVLYYSTLFGISDIEFLFIKDKFNITTNNLSIISTITGTTSIFIQFILLPLFTKIISNKSILLIGIISMIINGLFIVFNPSYISLLYIGFGINALTTITFPAIATLKSNLVDITEQGSIQGALAGMQSLAEAIGPLIYSGLFTIGKMKSVNFIYLPYIFSFIIIIITFIIGIRLPINNIFDKKENEELNTELLSTV
jgi:DHA1 family tetracycline resistance protein-like MFS transporter